MFKKTSKNSQFRERNAALSSRVNTAGIDEDTFKRGEIVDLRSQLQIRKKEIEIALRNMKTQMARAKTNNVSDATWRNWCAQRANLISEIQAIDLKLSELRSVKLKNDLKSDETFEMAFLSVAKEMLVKDVLDRLLHAAVLRVKNDD